MMWIAAGLSAPPEPSAALKLWKVKGVAVAGSAVTIEQVHITPTVCGFNAHSMSFELHCTGLISLEEPFLRLPHVH